MYPDEQEKLNKRRDSARDQALASLRGRVHGADANGVLSGGNPRSPDYEQYGKVTLWDLATKKYVTVWPVDAAEMIANGNALLDKPTDK